MNLRFVLLSLCLVGNPHSCHASSPSHCTYSYERSSQIINGFIVDVEYYKPRGRKHPSLLLLLHGSAGAYTLNGSEEPSRETLGEKTFARACYFVILPHYLESIGLKSLLSKPEIVSNYHVLTKSLNLILDRAEQEPGEKGVPVFIFGDSLGSYLAISLALQRNEITSVSEMSGGLPPDAEANRTPNASLLASHGACDDVVAVTEGNSLEAWWNAHHRHAELDIYPNSGHYWLPRHLQSVIQRTLLFFSNAQVRGGV